MELSADDSLPLEQKGQLLEQLWKRCSIELAKARNQATSEEDRILIDRARNCIMQLLSTVLTFHTRLDVDESEDFLLNVSVAYISLSANYFLAKDFFTRNIRDLLIAVHDQPDEFGSHIVDSFGMLLYETSSKHFYAACRNSIQANVSPLSKIPKSEWGDSMFQFYYAEILFTADAIPKLKKECDEIIQKLISVASESREKPVNEVPTGSSGGSSSPDPDPDEQGEPYEFFKRSDGMFDVKGFEEAGIISATKGLSVIQQLLSAKSGRVSMMILAGLDQHEGAMADSHSIQPVMDREALEDVGQGLKAAVADLQRAKETGDSLVIEECQSKVDGLREHLEAATGLRGKSRDLNFLADKLRPRISNQIKTAIDNLRKANLNQTADHFEICISAEFPDFTYARGVQGINWKTKES